MNRLIKLGVNEAVLGQSQLARSMGTSVSRSGMSVVPRQEPELIWTDAPPWNFSTDTKMASYWKRCVSV